MVFAGSQSDDCDDGRACTEYSCDPAVGCLNETPPGFCDDNDPCPVDTCEANVGCVNTSDPTCHNQTEPTPEPGAVEPAMPVLDTSVPRNQGARDAGSDAGGHRGSASRRATGGSSGSCHVGGAKRLAASASAVLGGLVLQSAPTSGLPGRPGLHRREPMFPTASPAHLDETDVGKISRLWQSAPSG